MIFDALFNENDRFAADWIHELFPRAGIDSRSIVDVQPEDVIRFKRVHLFGGIAGWELALRLADWPEDRPVWTGSCPCQPFSEAGTRRGASDSRHLWPEFRRLIAECRPSVVFGEQVASKPGRVWLCRVRDDMEEMGYAVGCADLCAACVGAPHERQRLYWVANSASYLGNCRLDKSQRKTEERAIDRRPSPWGTFMPIELADGKERRIEPGVVPLVDGFPARVGMLRGYGNAVVPQVAAKFIKAFMETEA